LSAVTVNSKAVRFSVCFKRLDFQTMVLTAVIFVPNTVFEAVDTFQSFKIVLSGKEFKTVYKSALLVHTSIFFNLLENLIHG